MIGDTGELNGIHYLNSKEELLDVLYLSYRTQHKSNTNKS